MRAKVLIAICVAVALSGCSTNGAENRPAEAKGKSAKAMKLAPPFTLKDTNGASVSLSDYKGKVVLLNFWATYCGPCKIEIPWFVEFEQKYKDQGFAVLGVSLDEEGWEVVKPYLEKNRINYRVMVGDDKLSDAYGGVESLPTTFLLDKEGRIFNQHIGLVSKSDYENEIRKLLDTRAGITPGVFATFARANQH